MLKKIKMEFNGEIFNVEAERKGETISISRDGKNYSVRIIPEEVIATKPAAKAKTVHVSPVKDSVAPKHVAGSITAPMTGLVKDILVQTGAKVKARQIVMIMEAMKMDIEIKALSEGTVKEIYAAANSNVSQSQLLMSIG